MNMRGVRRSGVVLVVLVVGTLSVAVSGASAAEWLAPTNVTLSVSDLGFDKDGNATAVGIGAGSGGAATIQAITRAPGGQWSAPLPVSGSGDSDAGPPQVAVNAQGDAVAVWVAFNATAGEHVVQVSSRPAGGAWSAPEVVSTGGTVFNRDQDVAIDAQGNATVIWSEIVAPGPGWIVRAAARPSGGAWSGPDTLSASALNSSPRLAVDPQGTVTAVWLGDGTLSPAVVLSNSHPAGGEWSAEPVPLSSDDATATAQGPQVAVDAQGNATAVWALHHFGGDDVAQTARRAAGDDWSTASDLGASSNDALPQVAVDPQGNATAIWEGLAPSGTVVVSSGRTAAGQWSNAAPMASGDGVLEVGYPWVAADPQGNVTAIWARFNSTDVIAQATRHVAGSSSWSPSVDLTVGRPITAIPAAGVDPQGHVSMVWSSTENPWSGFSSVFDPIGPTLSNLTVPAKATVGQAVGLSVNTFDAWSVVTTSWDFGDGQSASGAAASHAYTSPGQRTVTVTGVDAAGNKTQASQTITVEAAPKTPGPGPAPGPGHGPKPTPKAPVLSGLKQSSALWRTHTVKRGRKLPVGTTFGFKLDRAAQVRLAFEQIVSGRRVNGRCVKVTKANRTKRRCDRSQAAGTLNLTGKAGTSSVTFRGKLGGRTLAPGRYRVLVTASADGKRSAAKSLRFTIVR